MAERKQAEADRQAETQANILGHAVRRIVTETENRDRNPANPTTQLVKSRWPPIWTGQKFDKWKSEIENGAKTINQQRRTNTWIC